jgi:hypothetical protein
LVKAAAAGPVEGNSERTVLGVVHREKNDAVVKIQISHSGMGEEHGAGEGLGAGIKFAHMYSLRISRADARLGFEKACSSGWALKEKRSGWAKSRKLFAHRHRREG